MKKLLVIFILAGTLSSCNKEPENLKSPCVGASGSPCDRTPINQPVINQSVTEPGTKV